jgi:hypothetical protein
MLIPSESPSNTLSQPFKKPPKPLELFLDDGFSNPETAAMLRAADFIVHEFTESFPRVGDLTKREQSVEDPPIIELCHHNSWLLVTCDKEMCKKHRGAIRRCRNVTILATASNGSCYPSEWVQAIIKLGPELRERTANQRRPWFLFFSRQGTITANRDRMF